MRDNTLGWVSHRRTLLVVLIAAVIMGSSIPVWAVVLSHPTGKIEGRAPAATGELSILMPDGETTLVDNALVMGAETPNELTLAALSPGVVYSDEDGDEQGTPGITFTPSTVVWTWKGPNGTKLTTAQLKQTFATNFAHNDTLTVQVSVPVLSTSLTGNPRTSSPLIPITSPIYRVRVLIPAIRVNGYTFKWNSGFPTTGFVGATYQLHMNGVDATANGNYTYTVNQLWATVDTDGVVTFTGAPTSAADNKLRVVAKNNDGSADVQVIQTTISRWFVNGGQLVASQDNAIKYCTDLGDGYAAPGYDEGAGGSRSTERFGGQWGNPHEFGGGWAVPQTSNGVYYWTKNKYSASGGDRINGYTFAYGVGTGASSLIPERRKKAQSSSQFIFCIKLL
ncbi:hypothetical protein [Budvicia aquatica]|uniref:Invasin domain-containing protein n=1 Tax=Budvicia aquatica TaxID=82979 RepID=A0A2C6DLI7_9GAMM|nr:hypothetical protein [Budvicia aquatica]PHI30077.1 hypothetical protein CRN84_12355 [Budvicia aquatica]VFS49072.1 Uncharacterised protein [Budvicia aquatica]